MQARQDTTRLGAVGAVVIAKVIQHHVLFARYSYEIQGQECYYTGRPSNPVVQKQGLSEAQEPSRGLHRVADRAIHTVGDQLLLSSDF